jgi:predicted metalloprotease with PDZ domain
VRYRLTQFWEGDPSTVEYRPVIRRTYFHVIGWAAFARPKWSLATPISVSFKDVPKPWGVASDLERAGGTLADVLQSVTVGGDFRVLKAGELKVAIRGTWAFTDADFIKRLELIIVSHRRFWGDPPEAFLVTMLPLETKPNSMTVGGTNLESSFALFATTNAPDRRLVQGLTHEHLHNWIPRRLGMMPQENDGASYWFFSEGFTDFYMHRLLLRDGLRSVEETTQELNDVLWAYAFSPMRNAPNAKIGAEFWRDRTVQELPYQRGLLFAALADANVRRESGGVRDLDDVMLAMKATADAAGKGALPPVPDVFVTSMKVAGIDVADDIKRFIEDGETILLPEDVWAPCGPLATSEVAEFDRGFDGARTIANNNVATGVDPNGPAYAAGLRNGMRIRRVDLSEGGDSRVPMTLRVYVNGETREITYLPAGKRRVTVQELNLGSLDEAGRKACAARLGGTG